MILEIFAICDAATDYGGRLNVLGAFEGIAAPKAPIVRDRCSLAIRLRCTAEEVGEHAVCVRILSEAGQQIIPDMDAKIAVKAVESRRSAVINLVLNINRLSFPDFGDYTIRLLVDGKETAELPLLVAQAKGRRSSRFQMDN